MANIRKGDLVEVISGARAERGKQGTVLEVLAEQNRVIVEGVNYVTKHTRIGQSQRGSKTGGIETVEAPIHISNVALVDPDTKVPARVGFHEEEVTKDGMTRTVRTRYFKPSRRAEKPAKDDTKADTKKATSDSAAKKPAKAKKADADASDDTAAEKDSE
ncbi:hypothetical protein GCM10011490_25150 [Pseudoclavibacter endophyticus]|uniref:Large ribosomal subunit protein uL24 n=1 Tax=Pseudoclavibacter endophyticus TaxID=1778590 RepID=A0A6H9WMS2_9MICO|nr:50S ribosomal protein L24 [Pseudoclavibacter endophyticus]GGA73277.1 hypothetical protein GCM10011490_25150 [Pseudoclavibacter endophyticus]